MLRKSIEAYNQRKGTFQIKRDNTENASDEPSLIVFALAIIIVVGASALEQKFFIQESTLVLPFYEALVFVSNYLGIERYSPVTQTGVMFYFVEGAALALFPVAILGFTIDALYKYIAKRFRTNA